MKEWDGKVFRCETCDNLYLWNQYDSDARMCVYCAVIDLIDEGLIDKGEQNG